MGAEGWDTIGDPYKSGGEIMSNVLKRICDTLNIKQLTTSAYHAQTYGLVKQFSLTLTGMLCTCIHGDPRKWELMIPLLLFSIRQVPQASMGCTPFDLAYGHRPWRLLDIVCEGREEKGPAKVQQLCPIK